jgi:putative transferase (TIGR04331 family)
MVSRFLITTSDESTWKFDRPVIFLGEWCRLYERRHIWQDMDAIVAEPYGLGQEKKDADHAHARALEDKLLPVLCDTLNRYHGTEYGARFWRIVLGHWFRRFVNVMLNRVKTLEKCLQAHQISGTAAFDIDHYSLTPSDSYSAIFALNDDHWNNVLSMRILALLGVISFPVEVILGNESPGFGFNPSVTTSPTLTKKILRWGYQQIRRLAGCLVRDNDAFIISSYLPKKLEIKLQLALGQCPQLWVSPKLEMSGKPDRELRKNLARKVACKSSDSLECILTAMVFELLPVCYLEGFVGLNKVVNRLPWPVKPKFIFTSNNFDSDEIFKLWTAKKTEQGSAYITGQHGANYGTHRYIENNTIEESTSSKFLSWGWTEDLPQHTPAFIFKTAGSKEKNYNQNGGLLLIELHLNNRLTTWDDSAEFANYFEEQQYFVSQLASEPKQHLTIRLHYSHRDLKWNEEARWDAFDPSLKIDTGGVAIKDLIAQSRLVVHSYDSTGILETLSQNIPTIAFWQNGFDHLRAGVKTRYQLLVDAGIVHLTPDSAVKKVNEVWDDVDEWWGQEKVKYSRMQFCDQYARVSRTPARDLLKILKA